MARLKQLRGWTKYPVFKELNDEDKQIVLHRARKSGDSFVDYPYSTPGVDPAPPAHGSSLVMGDGTSYILLGDGSSTILLG